MAGTALALGYYNNREQTEKVFVQNPLNPRYPERIYRTGDLGYYGEDGELYFASRKDFQIKHMGHRIELEEIESAMNAVENVQRSCCIFQEEKNRIIGFYMGEIEPSGIRKKLKEKLPVYMRSRATFKQLVEHADARERLKADEEKRLRVCTVKIPQSTPTHFRRPFYLS